MSYQEVPRKFPEKSKPHIMSVREKKMSRISRSSFALVFLIIATLVTSSCTKKKSAQKMQKPPVPVTVGQASLKKVPLQLKAIGTVEPSATVSVRSQVGGLLSKVHFTEGQEVNKGDLLFTIDPRPFEAQIRQYEAVLSKDRAQLENAKEEARRYADLAQKGYVARDLYEQLKTNELALEATVNADKAVLENARLQLGYCSIYSPVSGRTGSLMMHEGNLVKANADTAMVIINQVRPVYVTFSVPEKNLDEIRRRMKVSGLNVSLNLSGGEDYTETGRLSFIENIVDLTTGTIKLKGAFQNRDGRLWPGRYVNTTLTLSETTGVVIPSQAIQTGQQGQHVFVIKDGAAELRQVTPGPAYEGMTLIEKGLAEGEQVVLDGQMRLVPGAAVETKNPEGQIPGQTPAQAGKAAETKASPTPAK